MAYNELTGGPFVRSPLQFSKVGAHQAPVDDPIVGRRWTDADTAALNVCLSAPTSLKGYGRDFARQDIEDAMLLAAQENSYMPELKGIHRGMIQDIKQYFTSEKDTVRLAYRRNVTIGTTNEDEYLRDDENRRFCPIPVTVDQDNVLDFESFIPLVPQLWAEADLLYLERRAAQPKGQLDLNFRSAEAKREARERQQAARETLIHEPVAEVAQEWLDHPISAEALAENDPSIDDFDGLDESLLFVRNYVTATMIRRQLGTDPVIRDLRMNPEKVIGMAMKSLEGWVNLGNVRRLGKRARWYVREGLDDNSEYVPLEAIQGAGDASEPSADDLLG